MMRRGFTLLELMVVLVLLAITATAAVPAFLAGTTQSPERRAAGALADVLLRTRDAARASGAAATLVLSPEDGRFWITTRDSSATGTLPLGNAIRIVNTEKRIACRFEARGPASPCTITVTGIRTLTVRVDAWSGEIRADDATR